MLMHLSLCGLILSVQINTNKWLYSKLQEGREESCRELSYVDVSYRLKSECRIAGGGAWHGEERDGPQNCPSLRADHTSSR
jgi:hypothetical protein